MTRNTLRSVSLALYIYISRLSFKFDIITNSETWFSEHTNINIFNIEGYNMLYVSRNGGKGGGVAIYINSEFRYNKMCMYRRLFWMHNCGIVVQWVQKRHHSMLVQKARFTNRRIYLKAWRAFWKFEKKTRFYTSVVIST